MHARVGPAAADGEFLDQRVDKLAARLDLDPPVTIERRLITATVDRLDEVITTSTTSGGPSAHPLRADVQYGGRLTDLTRVSKSHSLITVGLPRPLAIGESHEFCVELSAHPRALMQRYHVLNPLRRYEDFTLRARFPPDPAPRGVWRIEGIPLDAVDEYEPVGAALGLDGVGEVEVRFAYPQVGLAYGVQWQW
ncbi:hypothetical protein [Actinokineospora sp. NBRC 105648]|uniref:hypothetical protein n=1 Tax=Actinokineospora sp. NBRC 105648 TaxID=3032206 RepID=UPI0024A3E347|nr:hypothetical protein [Actinokineospora sp. NBRC 105648]GLZ36770.1 hypothetical protein Acsp05_03950 [Actinokineospora sp. NBRC 105648]